MADKEAKRRWEKAAQNIMSEALSGTEGYALLMLGVAIRKLESTRARAGYITKVLKKRALRVMEAYGISEKMITQRTFIRLDHVLTIPNDDEGKAVYERIGSNFGRKLASKLIKRETVKIPIQRIKTFAVNEEVLATLSDQQKEALAKTIGNPDRLFVGDIPKRALKGQKRAPRTAKQKKGEPDESNT